MTSSSWRRSRSTRHFFSKLLVRGKVSEAFGTEEINSRSTKLDASATLDQKSFERFASITKQVACTSRTACTHLDANLVAVDLYLWMFNCVNLNCTT